MIDDMPKDMFVFVQKTSLLVIFLVVCISVIGLVLLFSASGSFEPWCNKQILRLGIGILLMLGISYIDIRAWFSYAYLLFFISVVFLVLVDFLGSIGMGARRWINILGFTFQPSEGLRIFLILALSRYFHVFPVLNKAKLLQPLIMIFLPTLFLIRQPDLGTAVLVILSSLCIFFIAGVSIGFFISGALLCALSCPIIWSFLHDYQKQRILVFLNPESDPLFSGYHILQSKIALGSGGLFGKGFLQDTQGKLNFLPEKQTDFIFSLLGEQFGFYGEMVLLFLYILLIIYNMHVALCCRSSFGRFVTIGLNSSLFVYVFVNVGMVCGMLPVVGIPLPLVSYGGTAMLSLLISQGIIFSARNYSDIRIGIQKKGFGMH